MSRVPSLCLSLCLSLCWGACTFDVRGVDIERSSPNVDRSPLPIIDARTLDRGASDRRSQPMLDQGPAPRPDKGVQPPRPDRGLPLPTKSSYGQFCASNRVGQTCPDGKTTCIASPYGVGGICTVSCALGLPCPQGRAGTRAECGDVNGPYCYFVCKRAMVRWSCPFPALTCKVYEDDEWHCWP